jgi:hypothetical protein
LRIASLILLFLNLTYFAWAQWIDVPASARATESIAKLPQLVLASEANGKPGAIQTAAASSPRCVSVGPFNTTERATDAANLLAGRGFEPKQRAEQGDVADGYWVYVGGLKNALEVARVMHMLEQAALTDARIMPDTEDGGRVSVGLFSERFRAERRARVVQKLGLKPEIGERRTTGTRYWLDLSLAPDDRGVSAEGLLNPEESDARLEVRACPAVQSPPASG